VELLAEATQAREDVSQPRQEAPRSELVLGPRKVVEISPLANVPLVQPQSKRRATDMNLRHTDFTSYGGSKPFASFEVEGGRSGAGLDSARDRRQVKSWSAGTQRREVLMPLRPVDASSWIPATTGDQDVDDEQNRTFGGITNARSIRPTLPTIDDVDQLVSFAESYKKELSQTSGRLKGLPKIVAFVNSRSGGQIGELILKTLNDNLGTEGSAKPMVGTVADLSKPDEPSATIESLAADLRIGADVRCMVCGGDGTVTWILTALEQCRSLKGKLHRLPVSIVPLGTGNDLARSLGWGPKLGQVSDVLKYLKWAVQAVPVAMDQWRLVLRPHEVLPENHKLRTCGSHPQLVSDKELAKELYSDMVQALDENTGGCQDVYLGYWQNYFSVGVDAKVARYVDVSRSQTNCGRCCFRNGCGKVCYAYQAAMHAACGTILTRTINMMKVTPPAAGHTPDHPLLEQLEELNVAERRVNGRRGRMRQLMFVNINSYGAGLKVLPEPSVAGRTPAPGDGVLEVLGLRNVLTGLGVYAGLTRPTYFCSTEAACFNLEGGECLQLDGEPWRLECGCDVLIELHRKVTMLRAPDEARWWKGNVKQSFWTPIELNKLAEVQEDTPADC